MNYLTLKMAAQTLLLIALAQGLTACGGTKVLKNPEPQPVLPSLATTSDQYLDVTLDWVIVRGGPGTWAKNADWDEYLLQVRNTGEDAIHITNISVIDSLGIRIDAGEDRKQLVRGSREATRRYQGEGLKVRAGAGARTLLSAGALAGATTAAIAAAGPLALSTGATAVALGGLVLAPALAVGGVMRGVNNGRVGEQIELRQSPMPVTVEPGKMTLDVFFPITPSPRQMELTYVDDRGQHILVVDTSSALEGLHLQTSKR